MSSKMNNSRYRSKIKIRRKISGTPEIPRLTIFRSLNHVYAQLIDDTTGKTLISASSLSKELSDKLKDAKSKIDKSKMVGELLAQKAKDNSISNVVFDRNGYRYHGRVQAVAEGARKGGLKF